VPEFLAPLARTAGVVTWSVICAPAALAQSHGGSVQEQLQALHEAVQAQQSQLAQQQELLQAQAAEIEKLRQELQARPHDSAIEDLQRSANNARLEAQDAPRIAMSSGRPTITSSDGRSSLAVRAVVQLDMAEHSEAGESSGATDFRRGSTGSAGNRETNAARDLSDGIYFRRARLGFEGTLARDFNYRAVFELGGSGTEGPTRINDFFVGYTGFAPFTIQLGAFSPPANMDDGTSVESSLMIERASPAEMSRALGGADGRIGLGVRGSGTRWMSSLTLTSRTVNDAEVFDSQLALVGRYGRLVATSGDYNIHTGFSGTWVFQPPDQGSSATGARYGARFRDRPELRVDSTRLIDTGSIDADSVYVAGMEFGANYKSWYLQGENFWYGIQRPSGSPLSDPRFGGFYVQGSWILTGEMRRYDAANGSFQSPRPFIPFSLEAGGTGAWELALRYSHADLNYHAGTLGTPATLDSVRGGEQNIWTLGVNWYVNPNLRVTFNYFDIDVDRLNPAGPGNLTPFGPAPATPPFGVQIGQELSTYALRTQYSF
jgi:phosphate-selective porin OprO and OprP